MLSRSTTYSVKRKDTCVKLALASTKSTAGVAPELDLPSWKLHAWVIAAKNANGGPTPASAADNRGFVVNHKMVEELMAENCMHIAAKTKKKFKGQNYYYS